MFCNQCGKENKDGTKFCIYCGAPVKPGQPAAAPAGAAPGVGYAGADSKNEGIKSLLTVVLVFILLLTAAINIIGVPMGMLNVSARNEMQQANGSAGIWETNACIYYNSGGLQRMDKAENTVTKLSNKAITIVAATDKGVYGFDDKGNYYSVADGDDEIEKIEDFTRGFGSHNFMSGKYSYSVSSDGEIIKSLNSGKYDSYSIVLCEENDEKIVSKAEIYKGYIYMIMSDSAVYPERDLIRVSLRTGKTEQLTENSVSGFSFADDRIICNDDGGGFFAIDLDGGNALEYTEIESVVNSSFICANGCVYYVDSGKMHRFPVDGGADEELGDARYGLTEINGGFAILATDGITLLDYDLNEVTTASL